MQEALKERTNNAEKGVSNLLLKVQKQKKDLEVREELINRREENLEETKRGCR